MSKCKKILFGLVCCLTGCCCGFGFCCFCFGCCCCCDFCCNRCCGKCANSSVSTEMVSHYYNLKITLIEYFRMRKNNQQVSHNNLMILFVDNQQTLLLIQLNFSSFIKQMYSKVCSQLRSDCCTINLESHVHWV